jgi:methylated-DNA-[protein]-cysteine S-methyltransferase
MRTDYQAVVAAPFGALGLRVANGMLTAVDFLSLTTQPLAPKDPAVREICECLTEYLRNPRCPFHIPISVAGTPFQQHVWSAIRQIPVGEILTYSELAQRVASGPRAVANACGANPIPVVIPCHRVVAKHGLGGFMQGRDPDSLSIKRWLLRHERSKPAPSR